jgi:hypothetical protein
MEQAFGVSFGDVRAYTDPTAARANRDMGALAYTVGNAVAFTRPDPAPELVAHELAHVVQQRAGAGPTGAVGAPGDAYEREADAVAAEVAGGKSTDLAARYAPTSGSPARVQHRVVQRFNSQEHQSLGNEGSQFATYDLGKAAAGDHFALGHGDVVALAGDYFPPDELFRLAEKAGQNGTRAGSRDEVIYALYLINKSDSRFQSGGAWEKHALAFKLKDSQPVREAVDARYQKLAASNTSHFAAPRGRDAQGNPLPTVGQEGSAPTSYHEGHEQALRLAYQAGKSKGAFDRALATEAAAQHFLTDSFSAGHLRTPIGDIRSYWGQKYPLFWYNLRHKMALDTAIQINAQHSNATSGVATVQTIYESISGQIEALAGGLPAVTLGDLLAKVFHDWDNIHGLSIAGGGTVFGDDHLDQSAPGNVTRSRAVAAVRAGNHDVEEAFRLGQSDAELDDAALRAAVRSATRAPADRYLAETLLPKPAADVPAQNWSAASFEELWDRPVVGKSGPTVGQQIQGALADGQEIRQQLEDLAGKFPEVDKHFTGNLKPRQAYLDGFVRPLAQDPKGGLASIIHWAPNDGLRGVDRDDVSLSTGQDLDRHQQLDGMTTPARIKYVRELIAGSVDSTEGDLVVRIFATAPAGERRQIYRAIEGHDWKGDWVEGVFTSDDQLWNALSRDQLKRLRDLINGA